MWWLVIGAAIAGDLEISVATPALVFVDGKPQQIGPSMVARARNLSGGAHEVVVRNLLGKKLAELSVEVSLEEEVRLRYASKELRETGRGALASAADAPESAVQPVPGATAARATAAPATTPEPPAASPPSAPAAPAAPSGASAMATTGGAGAPASTATASVQGSNTGSTAQVEGGVVVDGQQLATVEGQASETGAAIGLSAVDPATGERVEIGLTVGVGGMGVDLGGGEAAPAPPAPISASDLEGLVDALDDAAFSSDQLAIIQTASANHHFQMAQILPLLDQISMSEDKLAALRDLAPRVVDPGSAHLLSEAFSFSSDREAAQALFR